MAKAVLNPLFISISGRIGGFVFYRRKNTQCIRSYVLPRNPDTISQRNVRLSFAGAVKSWQTLSVEERYKYTRKSRGTNMSGYNLYISEYMKRKVFINPKRRTGKSSNNIFHLYQVYPVPKRIRSVSYSTTKTFLTFTTLKKPGNSLAPT